MKTRQLNDRVEFYLETIEGKCQCGEAVNKTTGSSCTMWNNGDRFHYPHDNTATGIFRCKRCHNPIHETFYSL